MTASVAAQNELGGAQDSLILWKKVDEICRLGDDADLETQQACQKRADLQVRLQRFGWCRGKLGETEEQYRWHHCRWNSVRFITPP